jgi:3-oxoacyl-[acyl-carrier protein] reductase
LRSEGARCNSTGASQGIGRATAIRLAPDLEAVVLPARKEHEVKKTAAPVESAGAEPLTYALNLREPRSAEILVEGTVDRFGRSTALVNIAGDVSQIDPRPLDSYDGQLIHSVD